MAGPELSNPERTPPRRSRVALIVKDPAERQALMRAIEDDPETESIILEQVQALSEGHLDPMDVVVISHQTLARFRGADTMSFTRLCRGARVIIALTSDQLLEAAGTMGMADGWVFSDMNPEHLPDVIDLSRQGYSIMPEAVVERLTANKLRVAEYEKLTDLERQVIDLVSEGLGNQDIADRLGLTASHTKALVKSALSRLHFQNRTQAAVFIARQVKSDTNRLN